MGARGRRRDRRLPQGDTQGLRRARAAGAGSVRGRRGYPAGSHAAGLRGCGGGHQPRGVVHPALHAPLPALDGGAHAAAAGLRTAGPRLHGSLSEGAGRADPGGAARGAGPLRSWGRRGAGRTAACRRAATGLGRGVRLAFAGLGRARAGGGAAFAGGALSDIRRIRTAAAQGARAARGTAGSAFRPATAAPAGAGRQWRRIGVGAQRGVRFALSQGRVRAALGGEACGGVSVGAHGAVRRLPGGGPAAEDALAVQDGAQARAADDGAARRRKRSRLRRRARRARRRRERGAEAGARPRPGRRHHARQRRRLPGLRRAGADGGYRRRGPRRAARRAHHGCGCGRAAGQGIPAADGGGNCGGRCRMRGARRALFGDPVRPSGRAYAGQGGARFSRSSLRFRPLVQSLHRPAVAGAGNLRAGVAPLRRRDGRLP